MLFVWMKTIDKLGDDFELEVQKFVVEGGQSRQSL